MVLVGFKFIDQLAIWEHLPDTQLSVVPPLAACFVGGAHAYKEDRLI